MYINYESRKSIAKFISTIGLIFLLLAIFTEIIEFRLGIMIALILWTFSGVFKTWLKIDKSTETNYFQTSRAFSKLLSSIGGWIIVYSIFMDDLEFSNAIIIAIIFFIASGVFKDSSGSKKRRKRRKRRAKYSTPILNQNKSEYKFYDEDKYDIVDEGPAKFSCRNCGHSIMKDDIFCSNCGESN